MKIQPEIFNQSIEACATGSPLGTWQVLHHPLWQRRMDAQKALFREIEQGVSSGTNKQNLASLNDLDRQIKENLPGVSSAEIVAASIYTNLYNKLLEPDVAHRGTGKIAGISERPDLVISE